MYQIDERLHIGEDLECFDNREGWITVHACKSPCHQRIVGYKGNLDATHPNYLILENENNLYLNLIDPPISLFKIESFEAFLRFAEKKYKVDKLIFIHCNRCESRAPSLALLFLAKVIKKINNDSYETAKIEFLSIYPNYKPGIGIQRFLTENWNKI